MAAGLARALLRPQPLGGRICSEISEIRQSPRCVRTYHLQADGKHIRCVRAYQTRLPHDIGPASHKNGLIVVSRGLNQCRLQHSQAVAKATTPEEGLQAQEQAQEQKPQINGPVSQLAQPQTTQYAQLSQPAAIQTPRLSQPAPVVQTGQLPQPTVAAQTGQLSQPARPPKPETLPSPPNPAAGGSLPTQEKLFQLPPPEPPQDDPIPVANNVPSLPLWQRLGPLTWVADSYARYQRKRPYWTQLLSALIISVVSDLSVQRMNKDRAQYSPLRTLRSITIGAISAIPTYKWVVFLSHNFNYASRTLSLGTKVAINQLVYTPVFNSYFFFMQAKLAGETVEESVKRVIRTVPISFTNSVKVWPAVTAFSFAFIPLEYRSIFSGVIAVVWQTYLVYLNRRDENTQVDLRKEAAHEGVAVAGDSAVASAVAADSAVISMAAPTIATIATAPEAAKAIAATEKTAPEVKPSAPATPTMPKATPAPTTAASSAPTPAAAQATTAQASAPPPTTAAKTA